MGKFMNFSLLGKLEKSEELRRASPLSALAESSFHECVYSVLGEWIQKLKYEKQTLIH